MLRSEAHLDHDASKLYRLRYPGYTGDLGGILFEQGEATAGVTLRVVQRLQGIFGASAVQVVGPWEPTPAPSPPPTPEATALPLAPPEAPAPRKRAKKDDAP